MLVAVLSGVFDPPPATIDVPWGYLAATTALTPLALGAAAIGLARPTRTPATTLRER